VVELGVATRLEELVFFAQNRLKLCFREYLLLETTLG
jgi:hypothetical protein